MMSRNAQTSKTDLGPMTASARYSRAAPRFALHVFLSIGVGLALGESGFAQSETPGPQSPLEFGEVETNLSPQQMKKRVTQVLDQISLTEQTIAQLWSDAKKNKDVVKVVCLGDKSSQLAKASEAGKERGAEFESALTEKNTEKAKHQYSMIVVIGDRVIALMSEANQCIGADDTSFAGESETTIEIDEDLPEILDSIDPIIPFIAGEEPTVQSPDG